MRCTHRWPVQPAYLPRFTRHFQFWKRRSGLSQLEIAQQLGIDPTSVSAWANGKNFPNMLTLYRLCEEVFQIEVWQFFRRPPRARSLRMGQAAKLVAAQ